MLNWKVILLLIVWGITGIVGWFIGGQSTWFWFYGLGALNVLVVLHAVAIRSCKVSRVIEHTSIYAGETVLVNVTLDLKTMLPLLWIAVEEPWSRFDMPYTFNRSIRLVGFHTVCSYTYALKELQRGEYESEEVRIRFGDVFGFCQNQVSVRSPVTFLVYPQPTAIPYKIGGTRSGYEENEFKGIRPYREGDSLSRIHWKISAGMDKWKTKLWEPERKRHLTICLDSTVSEEPQLELAVDAAAGYAYAAHQQGCQIQIVLRDDLQEMPIRRYSYEAILKILAKVQMSAKSQHHFRKHGAAEGTYNLNGAEQLCIISSFEDLRLLDMLAHGWGRHQEVFVIWIGADRMEPTRASDIRRRLAQLGCKLDVLNNVSAPAPVKGAGLVGA